MVLSRKDHRKSTKLSVHYINTAVLLPSASYISNDSKISSLSGGRAGYHKLLELMVKIIGCDINCLIDSRSMHNFIYKKVLIEQGLHLTEENTLEIMLVDRSKVTIDKVCHILI